ncbi:plasmid pRiA4b ORF-3 family protein [Neorhodopirellula pilleata]|uniref:plasmid pRiA4b ORF-3 family protein n=1 Tax=Neorhodopirellula pilleata TaxID=2714738 RepID=UPI001E4C5BE3|nr:plasmid pRiA4b ORF-3 family protein [Neorhodopirellula pilleata]
MTKTELAQQSGSGQTVYQFKISLRGIKPPIWRSIETLDVTLSKFHEAIQTAIGWTNSHLHAFVVGQVRYTDPRMLDDVFPDPSEKPYGKMKISDLVVWHHADQEITLDLMDDAAERIANANGAESE